MMETPDARTHENESAIDDEMMPINMTDKADDLQPIPGIASVPADMPNSPHGDVSLEYTLQNFNALVAANTAMTSEIANMAIIIADLRDRLEGMKSTKSSILESSAQVRSEKAAALASLKAEEKEHVYTKAMLSTAERRLERAKGYIDRCLDNEVSAAPVTTRTIPASKVPVGPSLGDIAEPVRVDSWYHDMGLASLRPSYDGESFAPRRY